MFGLVACEKKEEKPADGTKDQQGNTEPAGKETRSLIHVNAGMSDDFQRVTAQALKEAVEEAGWTYELMDPNGNMNTQVEMIENATVKNPDVIAINSIDPEAIVPACQAAIDKGILIIEVGNIVNIEDMPIRAFPDFAEVGEIAMTELCEAIGGEGEILLMNYEVRSAAVVGREEGWRKVLKKYPNITVTEQFADLDYAAMQTVAENMLQAHPNAKGIFGDTGAGVVGAVNAALALGRTDLVITGADSDKEILRHIKEGNVLCSVASDLPTYAKTFFAAAKNLIEGKDYESVFRMDNIKITQENVDEVFQTTFGYSLDDYIKTGK